jgi:DTW domain-containing protein YfiP
VQHPDEASHPFTTSYLATLGAASVHFISAMDVSEQKCLNLLQISPDTRIALLYTDHRYAEHETIVLDCDAHLSPILATNVGALIVLDGTWRNTRELMLRNHWLASLTTLELKNPGVSEYTVRKVGADSGQVGDSTPVCTIEAISRVLSAMEPDFQPDLYLQPMRELMRQQALFTMQTGPRCD